MLATGTHSNDAACSIPTTFSITFEDLQPDERSYELLADVFAGVGNEVVVRSVVAIIVSGKLQERNTCTLESNLLLVRGPVRARREVQLCLWACRRGSVRTRRRSLFRSCGASKSVGSPYLCYACLCESVVWWMGVCSCAMHVCVRAWCGGWECVDRVMTSSGWRGLLQVNRKAQVDGTK